MRQLRAFAVLLAGLLLAGCGVPPGTDADEAAVGRNAYVHGALPSMTLLTVVNARTGGGAHTGLMINGSERVIFDPAGSFRHPEIVERGDVIYAVTPAIEKTYIDYHVRDAYDMVAQTVPLSREEADRLIALAEASGATPRAFCARAASGILREAGFTSLGRTFYPGRLMQDMGRLPGVRTRKITVRNVDRDHPTYFSAREPDYPV